MDYASAARLELARRAVEERGRYYVPTGRIEEVIGTFKQFKPRSTQNPHIIYRSGVGSGKTTFVQVLADYLSSHFPHHYFDQIPYLRHFKRPNRGRIYTTLNAAKLKYPTERTKWRSEEHT